MPKFQNCSVRSKLCVDYVLLHCVSCVCPHPVLLTKERVKKRIVEFLLSIPLSGEKKTDIRSMKQIMYE